MKPGTPTETVNPFGPDGPPGPISWIATGTRVADRFEIVRPLGFGGSSLVYEAIDLELDRPVALKLLRSDRTNETSLKRFRREVAVARECADPRVVRVHDLGESEYGNYISMELIRGESLRQRIERDRLSIDEAVRVAREILGALATLHDAGIVHRDLKPSNVLLDEEGRVRLADFGLARHWDDDESRATQTDTVVGTLEYLAPEQILGRPPATRSDLYALGVLLYESLTGELPISGSSAIGTAVGHIKQRAPDVRRVRPDVPGWLAAIVSRLLEKDPASRYAKASEVLRDLGRRRAGLWIRRRTAIAAVAIAVLAVLAWGAWEWTRPKFHELVADGSSTRAIDVEGRTLWSLEQTYPNHFAPVRRDGKLRWIAGFRGTHARFANPERRKLLLFEPDSGRVEVVIDLPDGAAYFPEFADAFAPGKVQAIDLDRDGSDEILIQYSHVYRPFYVVLVDPDRMSARTLMAAGGHHAFAGTQDLDGDGRDEILFTGMANKLGWYAGLAAVQVDKSDEYAIALTPDLPRTSAGKDALLWYALMPRSHLWHDTSRLTIDRNEIVVKYPNGSDYRLDFDGFPAESRSEFGREERTRFRDHTYTLLRVGQRFGQTGRWEDAVAPSRRAASLAGAAAAPFLEAWARRSLGTALIRSGEVDEGIEILSKLHAQSEAAADIAFDTATALHLAGHLEEAIPWYWRGLEEEENLGRLKYEFVEGIVAARVELGQTGRALDEIERTSRLYSLIDLDQTYRNFVLWRAGEPMAGWNPAGTVEQDFPRVMELEFRRESGVPAPELLRLAEIQAASVSGDWKDTVEVFRGEVLRQQGRTDEAIPILRAAETSLRVARDEEPMLRTFHQVARERLDRALADAAGKE
ncbi:MAG: protein kinase [Thermoanaerobaculia bacterium]